MEDAIGLRGEPCYHLQAEATPVRHLCIHVHAGHGVPYSGFKCVNNIQQLGIHTDCTFISKSMTHVVQLVYMQLRVYNCYSSDGTVAPHLSPSSFQVLPQEVHGAGRGNVALSHVVLPHLVKAACLSDQLNDPFLLLPSHRWQFVVALGGLLVLTGRRVGTFLGENEDMQSKEM